MRQLFLPACVCLAAWSGTTNSNPRFTLDEFTGGLSAARSNGIQLASLGPIGITADEQMALKPSIDPDLPDQSSSSQETSTKDSSTQETPVQEISTQETSTQEISTQDSSIRNSSTQVAPAEKVSIKVTPEPSLEEIAALIPDGAIEAPVPSGVVVNNGEPAGIPLPPIAKPVIARSTEEICGTLADAAQRNDLPAPFFIRLLFQESRFKPGVISAAGAQGIAQFMPDTAASMGVDNPFDPLQAIPASARLLRDLFQRFGNLGLAAAAYNAGPKRIHDWLAGRGKGEKLPQETQGYVKTITGRAVETWTASSARHPGEKLPQRAPCQEAAGLLAWNGPDSVPMPSPSPLRAAAAKPKPADTKIAKADTKADTKAEEKAKEKAKEKAEAKAEVKAEAKAETKSDHKRDAKHKTAQADATPAHKETAKEAAKPATTRVVIDIKPVASGKSGGHVNTTIMAPELAAHHRAAKPERVAQR